MMTNGFTHIQATSPTSPSSLTKLCGDDDFFTPSSSPKGSIRKQEDGDGVLIHNADDDAVDKLDIKILEDEYFGDEVAVKEVEPYDGIPRGRKMKLKGGEVFLLDHDDEELWIPYTQSMGYM